MVLIESQITLTKTIWVPTKKMRESPMSQSSDFSDVKPPWIAFPDIDANDLVTYLKQGVTEAWFDQVWRPFMASDNVCHRRS